MNILEVFHIKKVFFQFPIKLKCSYLQNIQTKNTVDTNGSLNL